MGADLILLAVLCSGPCQAGQAEVVSASPRIAAIRFAIANGFRVPDSNLVVASEAGFERGKARATARTTTDLAREAREIAILLGPSFGFNVARAADHLKCPQSGACYAATNVAVLVIEEPFPTSAGSPHAGGSGIYIKLYSPVDPATGHATLQHAIVETTRSGGGWSATGFSPRFHPKTIVVR